MIIESWSISSWKWPIRIIRQRLELLREKVLVKAVHRAGVEKPVQERFCWSLTLTKNISCSNTPAWRWWCELYSYIFYHLFPIPASPPFDLSPSLLSQYWIYWSDLECFVLYPTFKFYLLLFWWSVRFIHTAKCSVAHKPIGIWSFYSWLLVGWSFSATTKTAILSQKAAYDVFPMKFAWK